jgi:hypothetical protein
MVKKCSGLVGTKDVTDWEDEFLTSIVKQTKEGDDTTKLSEKQIDVIQRIHDKNFGD